MGRDTGIILTAKVLPPFWVKVDRREMRRQRKRGEDCCIEICYWRNKWRLANIINNEFKMSEYNYADYEMGERDVKFVKNVVWDLLRDGRIDNLRERFRFMQDYINLAWLYRLLKARPVEVIYYDSF